jgi:hypothetical protein
LMSGLIRRFLSKVCGALTAIHYLFDFMKKVAFKVSGE